MQERDSGAAVLLTLRIVLEARRAHSRERHRLGGSGAGMFRSVRRRLTLVQQWQRTEQTTHLAFHLLTKPNRGIEQWLDKRSDLWVG